MLKEGVGDDRQGNCCFGQSWDLSLGARYLLCGGAHASAVIFVCGYFGISNQSLRAALLLTSVDKHSLSVSSLSGIKDYPVWQIQECVHVCVLVVLVVKMEGGFVNTFVVYRRV